jgi:DNA-directed RNA polymerase specialized sigma24 family protein
MGGTDKPGEHRGHSGHSSSHNGRGGRYGRSDHGGAAHSADGGRSGLYDKYYRSLLQFAALLTGDAGLAEFVVADVLAAAPPAVVGWSADDCLRYLQRLVLIRCRRGAGRYRRQSVSRGAHEASDFARLPVVMALLGLPRSAREAVVLTHYLDLPPAQAAAIAGVSETLLTANLATAMLALDDHLIGLSQDS